MSAKRTYSVRLVRLLYVDVDVEARNKKEAADRASWPDSGLGVECIPAAVYQVLTQRELDANLGHREPELVTRWEVE